MFIWLKNWIKMNPLKINKYQSLHSFINPVHDFCGMTVPCFPMPPIRDLHNVDEDGLLRMLTEYTNQYTKLFLQFTKEHDYLESKEMIDAIVYEIEKRKASKLAMDKERGASSERDTDVETRG
jgi:hypothetical protein